MASLLTQILGHDLNVERWRTALESKRLPSSSLFVGPSGVGKRKLALAITQALVCEKEVLACGQCSACQRIEKEQSESLFVVKPEGTQIKIDSIRQIIQFVSLQNISKARVIIIDGAEKLNQGSANALLKTLEEPPEETYFFLISTSLSKILPTIRSRSQAMRFSGLSEDELGRVTGVSGWALKAANGSVEKVLQLSENEDWVNVRTEAFQILQRSCVQDHFNGLGHVKDLVKDKEVALFVADLFQRWVKDLHYVKGGDFNSLSHPDQSNWSEKFVQKTSSAQLESLWYKSLKLEADVLGNVDRQLSFENFFMSCSQPS